MLIIQLGAAPFFSFTSNCSFLIQSCIDAKQIRIIDHDRCIIVNMSRQHLGRGFYGADKD